MEPFRSVVVSPAAAFVLLCRVGSFVGAAREVDDCQVYIGQAVHCATKEKTCLVRMQKQTCLILVQPKLAWVSSVNIKLRGRVEISVRETSALAAGMQCGVLIGSCSAAMDGSVVKVSADRCSYDAVAEALVLTKYKFVFACILRCIFCRERAFDRPLGGDLFCRQRLRDGTLREVFSVFPVEMQYIDTA